MASDRTAEMDCEAQVLGLAFHPSHDVLAAALVTGVVQLWRYPHADSSGEPELERQLHCAT